MGSDILIIRAWVRAAASTAKSTGKKLTAVLDEINAAILGGGVQDGQVLVSTSEPGGSVSFTLPPGHTPLELAALNEEAIAFCAQFPDPDSPDLTARRIKRLRASFAKAVIT